MAVNAASRRAADNMTQASVPFGKTLGEKRLEKTFTLRKFAELAGGSPTYLSQVEQCNVVPPTADRLKRIADLLEQNPDEWIALAGHVPEDVSEQVKAHKGMSHIEDAYKRDESGGRSA